MSGDLKGYENGSNLPVHVSNNKWSKNLLNKTGMRRTAILSRMYVPVGTRYGLIGKKCIT